MGTKSKKYSLVAQKCKPSYSNIRAGSLVDRNVLKVQYHNLAEVPKNTLSMHQRSNKIYTIEGFRDYSKHTSNRNADLE